MSMRDQLRKSADEAIKKSKKKPKKTVKKKPARAEPDDAAASASGGQRKTAKTTAKKTTPKGKKPKQASKATKLKAREFASGTVAALQTKIKRKKGDPSSLTLLNSNSILSEVTEWIPTGFAALDQILGGGWPVGRCVEVGGPEGSGKSALTHMAIKQCQDMGGVASLIDCETALDPSKLRQLGIDGQSIIYSNPHTLEDVWNIIYAILDQLKATPPEMPSLIIWDSIPAAVPKKVLEGEAGDANVALVARSMSENCGKVARMLADLRACLIWVNQERTKIGTGGYGPQYDTAGGKAVKYFSSLRVRCQRRATLKKSVKGEDVKTGYAIKTSTVKNRLYPPHRSANWVLDFKEGPSPTLTMLDHLKKERVIKSAGAKLAMKMDGEDVKFGRSEFGDLYREDSDFREFVDAQYDEKVLARLRWGTIYEDDDAESDDSDDSEGFDGE